MLSPGPDGFAVADFPTGQVVSEVPNLMLKPIAPVLKRPAAAMGVDPSQQYILMYYKKNNAIGVREKLGKKSR